MDERPPSAAQLARELGTATAAGSHLEFEHIGDVRLKGFSGATELFLAPSRQDWPSRGRRRPRRAAIRMLGLRLSRPRVRTAAMSASEHDQLRDARRQDGADSTASEAEALREQIEETREELGATVEALAHKADIKAQVHERVEERKEQLHQAQAEATGKLRETLDGPAVPAAIAAAGVLLLLLAMRRRRRAAL